MGNAFCKVGFGSNNLIFTAIQIWKTGTFQHRFEWWGVVAAEIRGANFQEPTLAMPFLTKGSLLK